jgi:phage baseplate assembly protein W
MPYRVEKKPLGDVNSKRKAIGVQVPFTGNAVFISTYQTVDAYRSNLLLYFLTSKGERYLNPDFGSDIPSLLFEQELTSSQVENLRSKILQDLANYFPKLVVDTLDIVTQNNDNALSISLAFHIKDTFISDTLTVDYE